MSTLKSLCEKLIALPPRHPVWFQFSKFCHKVKLAHDDRSLKRLLHGCRKDSDFLNVLRREFQAHKQPSSAKASSEDNRKDRDKDKHARASSRLRDIEHVLDEIKCSSLARLRIFATSLDAFFPLNVVNVIADYAGERLAYLDLGCSEGKITACVANYLNVPRESAFGVDIEPSKDVQDGAFTFVLYNGESLPWASATFDLATVFMAAHHFEHARETIASLRRVLKNHAILIVREHDVFDHATGTFLDFVHAVYATVVGDELTPRQFAQTYIQKTFAHYQSADRWAALFAEHGFVLRQRISTRDMFHSCYLIFEVSSGVTR